MLSQARFTTILLPAMCDVNESMQQSDVLKSQIGDGKNKITTVNRTTTISIPGPYTKPGPHDTTATSAPDICSKPRTLN